MEQVIVTLEQAKSLKELGFPQRAISSIGWYSTNGQLNNSSIDIPLDLLEGECAAPHLELVAKWLRDEKDIFININHISSGYSSWIKTISDNANIGANLGYVDKYEVALSNGIDKAIEILKEDKS